MENIVIKVEGMTCGHCKKAVENILTEQEGVIAVDVNLNESNATVSINPDLISRDKLVEVINDSGMYKAA
ncbi:MAG: heavy-metal-associated domain-containing protein [Bacteroidetes bacterium]|nr:heavy-metal-associated domain-containing protein [Bacteroidota bacterium]HET6244173.1 cation transporter [Bacteroidia bacterium]